VGLNIGQIEIQMPELDQIESVDASVVIGSVGASRWRKATGGFFRSFKAGGQGNYKVKAHLDIGEIELR
jgi:hypothetical protein